MAAHFSLEDQQQLRKMIETAARNRVAPRAAEISKDNPIERYFRDAVTQIIEGTNRIRRNIIGRYVIDSTN